MAVPESSAAVPLRVQRVPLASLVPDPGNARSHPKANVDAIVASLRRFGQAEPLVVQAGTRRVIAGHGRLLGMKALGWTACDIVELDVSGTDATALGIALNRTGELAEWDDGALARILEQLRTEDGGLDGVGFSTAEIDRLLDELQPPADDTVVEPPAVPVTRRGDVFLLGQHRFTCGDSTDAADVARALGGAQPFLMVTDPPYGVEYDPAWRTRTGLSDSDRMGTVKNDERVDWSAAYALFPGDVAYVWHAGRFASDVDASLAKVGLHVRSQIIWHKTHFAISRGHYHWGHEPCWYAVREGRTARWCGDRTQSTVWDISPVGQDAETIHGTQKPIECMQRPMRNHGASGDVVYDPFLGSGTSLIAAERSGRVLRGLELDPAYCDVIVTRWEQLTGKQATLDGSGETFEELTASRSAQPVPVQGA